MQALGPANFRHLGIETCLDKYDDDDDTVLQHIPDGSDHLLLCVFRDTLGDFDRTSSFGI